MPKLNQVLAAEKTVRTEAQRRITGAYHTLQKAALFSGLQRTYQPLDDEGTKLPSENQRVQLSATVVLSDATAAMEQLLDIVAAKDWTNLDARADVVLNGNVILAAVPVPYLLFLEKQLQDYRTVVSALPTLDTTEEWTLDGETGVFKSAQVKTLRTEKKPQNHVKAPATDKHPAQVEVFMQDLPVGEWTTQKLSAQLSANVRRSIVERTDELIVAVKHAREIANMTEVTDPKPGRKLMSLIGVSPFPVANP